MPTTPKTALVLEVFLWNEDDHDEPHRHEIVTGIRERIEAKRHFKKPVDQILTEGDEEGMLFLAWRGCLRYGLIHHDTDLDGFLEQVVAVDPEGIDEPDEPDEPDEDDGLTSGGKADTAGEGDPDGGRDD